MLDKPTRPQPDATIDANSGSESAALQDALNSPLDSYQDEIYVAGAQGQVPMLPTDLNDLEELAREQMSPHAFAYIAAGAGSGDTMRENREAFRRWRIVPKMLTDVSMPSYARTVLGTTLVSPILLGPIGVLGLAHSDAETGVAQVGADLDIPIVLSTVSTTPIEDVAAANGSGQRWFQLYWPNDRDLTISFLDRARESGFSTLVVTLDTRMLSWRPRDLDNGYLPFLHGLGVATYMTDPVFRRDLAEPVDLDPTTAISRYSQVFGDTSLTWDDLPFLRRAWQGPIVLKGILSANDALRAADAGVDGVIVSNHGGRQVDGAIAALDALPSVAHAVGSRIAVLFDSGIRNGSDIVKALALGARAVLIGRPYAYGLGLGGAAGVRHVVRVLRAEFELTMRLAGFATLDELTPDALTRSR
jgi:lactate 2-monooxygenase